MEHIFFLVVAISDNQLQLEYCTPKSTVFWENFLSRYRPHLLHHFPYSPLELPFYEVSLWCRTFFLSNVIFHFILPVGKFSAILQLELRWHLHYYIGYRNQFPIQSVQRLFFLRAQKWKSHDNIDMAWIANPLLSTRWFSLLHWLARFQFDIGFNGSQYAHRNSENFQCIQVRWKFDKMKKFIDIILQTNSLQSTEWRIFLVLHHFSNFSNTQRFILVGCNQRHCKKAFNLYQKCSFSLLELRRKFIIDTALETEIKTRERLWTQFILVEQKIWWRWSLANSKSIFGYTSS